MNDESTQKSNIGASSTGDSINWKYLKEVRVDDPVITELIKEATETYMNDSQDLNKSGNNYALSVYVNSFNEHLSKKKFKFSFTLNSSISSTSSDLALSNGNSKKIKKEKEKKLSKKELILLANKEEATKKEIGIFLDALSITDNMPIIPRQPIIAFFCVLHWTIYLISNKKQTIDLAIYLDASISLFRAIKDMTSILPSELVTQFNDILRDIETIILTKKTGNDFLNFMKANMKILAESFWDKNKPRAITLYSEQKHIIELVTSNLNNKILTFFEMPPANGKTVLSAILAKVIAYKNKAYLEANPFFYKRKTLLYICYNTIVRNEVAKLCITQNIDLKYWLAVTQIDKEDGIQKTFLRPYKNCYPDWNQKNMRTRKETLEYQALRVKRFSADIHDQWEFSLHETRPISEQKYTINDYENAPNIPEMIIADLESAYSLLKAYPNTFISYFDEAFASADMDITAKIMSVLGHTVLVSATLAKPSEIPTVLGDFKRRHRYVTDDYLHIVKSNVQHISCTFINSRGNIYLPHDSVESFDKLVDFLPMLDDPIVKRGYSPEVVFNMVLKIDEHLDDSIKFKSRFPHIGQLTHESLREYACDILRYIVSNNSSNIFELMKKDLIRKIPNMDIKTIFTTTAFKYQSGKTLHVATMRDFDNHVNNISAPFLEGSPKVSDAVSLYRKTQKTIEAEMANLLKNTKKDDDNDTISDLAHFQKELNELRLIWPGEYILNSRAHAARFGTSQFITTPNNSVFGQIEDMDILDDTRAKLFLSSIGVYQPSAFSDENMDQFLRNKDGFKFILSTPEIVYGTNISLSIIDIDSSFLGDSTRNTLYQLIGRAGRKGKSNSATIIFRNDEMLNFIFKTTIKNIEAENIERNFIKILGE